MTSYHTATRQTSQAADRRQALRGSVGDARSYARFIDDSRDYIISQALELVFTKDRDFAQWLQSAGDTEIRTESIGTRDADSPVNRAGPHREERTRRLRRELGGETRKRAWMAGQGVKPLDRLPSAGISSVSTWPKRWPRLGSAAQHPTMLETCKTCGRSWRMKDTRCGVTAVDVAAQPRFHQQLKW